MLAQPIVQVLFRHGAVSDPDARVLGWTLATFALGLIPFSAFQLHLRAFYALGDTRTPAYISIVLNAVNVLADLLLFVNLHGSARLPGLAGGYALSYVVGVRLTGAVLQPPARLARWAPDRSGPWSGSPSPRPWGPRVAWAVGHPRRAASSGTGSPARCWPWLLAVPAWAAWSCSASPPGCTYARWPAARRPRAGASPDGVRPPAAEPSPSLPSAERTPPEKRLSTPVRLKAPPPMRRPEQ